MIRVYLSGPITGLSEEEYTRRFARAEQHYKTAGYEVVNPVTIGQELQKTANGWVKPKNGKQPGAKKEEPKNVHGAEVDKIYERQLKRIKELKAKGFTDEQIDNDKIIKQTKEDMKNVGKKPENKKGPAESKPGRDRPALKKEDHVKLAKEVLSNTSATDPGWTAEEIAKEWKLGKADAEEVKKEFDNLRKGSSGNKPAAEKTDGFDYRSSMEKDPRSAASFKGAVSHSIPMNQTDRDELEGLSKFMSEEKATYQNALKNRAQALVDGHKGNGDWFPEKEKAIMKIAKAVGFDDELHKFIAEENRGYDLGYSEDAAPRTLTGDTRIRVRKA